MGDIAYSMTANVWMCKPLCELLLFGDTQLNVLVMEKSSRQRFPILKIRKGFPILVE